MLSGAGSRTCSALRAGYDREVEPQIPQQFWLPYLQCVARGLRGGLDGQNAQMEANKRLVREFAAAAAALLADERGEVHLTHKTKPPYSHWGIVHACTGEGATPPRAAATLLRTAMLIMRREATGGRRRRRRRRSGCVLVSTSQAQYPALGSSGSTGSAYASQTALPWFSILYASPPSFLSRFQQRPIPSPLSGE